MGFFNTRFFKKLRNSVLAAPFLLMNACGGTLYVEAFPPEEPVIELPDVRMRGSTDKTTYKVGEPVHLQGPLHLTNTAPDIEQAETDILLSSRTITPNYDERIESSLSDRASGTPPDKRMHVLLQCDTEAELQDIQLISPVPNNTWIASVPADLLQRLGNESSADLAPLRWAGDIYPDDKLHSLVKQRIIGPWNSAGGLIGLTVRFFKDVPLTTGESLALQYGGTVIDAVHSINALSVSLPEQDLESFLMIAEVDGVSWIEYAPALSSVNNTLRQIARVDELQEAWPQFDGTGIVVGVYDSGTVCEHEDFDSRVTIGVGEERGCSYHPTHVAGTVAGSGYLSESWAAQDPERGEVEPNAFRGVIPGAEIVSYSYSGCEEYCLYNSPGDIEDDYDKLINIYGVDLITNSIGSNTARNGAPCEINGSTDTTAVLVDSIVAGALGREVTVLYAAGNERGGSARCGDSYDTLGAPAAGSKNAIIVGATDDEDNPSSFTSWGPTDDGRIGVTVCMNGTGVMSTVPGDSYDELSGTSMATPANAGIAGALTQTYRSAYGEVYGMRPSPSLTKAVLANSAVDVGPPGIDYQCGFGRVDAFDAASLMLDHRTLEDTMQEAQTMREYQVNVTDTGRFKVTLAWTDYPGDPIAAKQLVSDLDLKLISPEGAIYRTQLLDPSCPACVAGSGADRTNNIEQILVEDAELGIYTLVVYAHSLPQGPQSFSIAYSPMRVVQQSVIENNDAETIEGYISMSVNRTLDGQVYPPEDGSTDVSWQQVAVVVDDLSRGFSRAIPGNGTLRLDEIWEGNNGFTPLMPGQYMVSISFNDEHGSPIEGKEGYVIGQYYFFVDENE